MLSPDLSPGAARIVDAITDARLSDLMAAFDHLGWDLTLEATPRNEEPVRQPAESACLCGTSPDPGVCPTDHGVGLPAGGHCACVHTKEAAGA